MRMLHPMSIWGKLAGAAAGLAVGGPIGALLGGFAGHFAIDRDKDGGEAAGGENQVAFTVGVIALGAKMAKADGVVTADEVNAFKDVFKVPEGEEIHVPEAALRHTVTAIFAKLGVSAEDAAKENET